MARRQGNSFIYNTKTAPHVHGFLGQLVGRTAARRIVSLATMGMTAALLLLALGTASVFAQSTGSGDQPVRVLTRLVVVVGPDGAQLWDRSGSAVLQNAPAATVLVATGRSADDRWLYVEKAGGAAPLLAAVHPADVIGLNLESLPVLAGSSLAISSLASLGGSAAVDSGSAVSPALSAAPSIAGPAPVTTPVQPSATVTAALPALPLPTATPAPVQPAVPDLPTAGGQITAEVTANTPRLNVRSGPGISYPIVTKATAGDVFTVIGRDAGGDWLQVDPPTAPKAEGWVAASYLTVSGPLTAVPVVAAPVEQAAAAASTPISQTAPVMPTAAAVKTSAGSTAATLQTVSLTPTAAAPGAAGAGSSGPTGLAGTLAFEEHQGGTIYAYNLATGSYWPVTHGFDPAISPDGRTIAFTREGGENGLYLINLDGANERKIYSERPSLSSPKWSPDGQWILFNRADETYGCIDVGPNNCMSLTEFKQRNSRLKPDQLEKLIKQYGMLEKSFTKVSAVDANGQNFHDIPTLPSARTPDWGAQGIVYQSAAGLQLTDDKPAAQNQLVTYNPLMPVFHDPSLQPNGNQVVAQQRQSSHWEIFSMNTDGSNLHALTQPATTLVDVLPSNVAPAWSPDGKRIVFLSNRQDDGNAGAWRLWVMNADGSNQHALPMQTPLDYTFGDEQMVSWGR